MEEQSQVHVFDRNEELEKEINSQLKDCLAKGEEILQLQKDTNQELIRQEKILDKIDENNAVTQNNIKKANWLVRGLKSSWGGFVNLFSKPPKSKPLPKPKPAKIEDPSDSLHLSQNIEAQQVSKNEEDELLDQLGDQVKQMKQQSLNMNVLLTDQNKRLDKIGRDIEKNDKEMKKVDRKIKKMLD